jgi:hypothetical protein
VAVLVAELGRGTPADAGGVTGPAAAGFVAGAGLKKDGCPLCLFHASQIRNRDIENTTQSRVRRISVMGGARNSLV